MTVRPTLFLALLALTTVSAGSDTESTGDSPEPKVLMQQAAMYLRGDQVETDVDRAIALYRRVAERDIAFAQYKLAQIFLDGRYIEADVEIALQWLKRAAALGFVEAQLELSRLYETDDRLETSLIDAYKWLRIAESLTELDLEERQQALQERMSFFERTRAEYLARRCIYRRYTDC